VDFTKEKLGRAHHMKFSAKPTGKTMAQVAREQVALAR
jgi:methanethiol oxidase